MMRRLHLSFLAMTFVVGISESAAGATDCLAYVNADRSFIQSMRQNPTIESPLSSLPRDVKGLWLELADARFALAYWSEKRDLIKEENMHASLCGIEPADESYVASTKLGEKVMNAIASADTAQKKWLGWLMDNGVDEASAVLISRYNEAYIHSRDSRDSRDISKRRPDYRLVFMVAAHERQKECPPVR